MASIRRRSKLSAYLLSLFVFAAAVWMPASAFAQVQLLGAGGGGVAAGGSAPDNAFFICDDGDPTKCGAFQASGISTGTTRTLTFPNANGTIALLDPGASQTFGSAIRFSNDTDTLFGTTNSNTIKYSTVQTPDTLMIGVNNAVNNSLVLAEFQDLAFDFAHGIATDPTLFIHSHNQTTTEYAGYTWLGPTPSKTTVTVDGATTFALTSSYITLACTGAETINTITGGITGMQLVLLNNDTDCTIADDDTATAANAINLTGTATNDVGAVGKHLTFIFDGNAWQQISESANN